jgi:hypothetical protein
MLLAKIYGSPLFSRCATFVGPRRPPPELQRSRWSPSPESTKLMDTETSRPGPWVPLGKVGRERERVREREKEIERSRDTERERDREIESGEGEGGSTQEFAVPHYHFIQKKRRHTRCPLMSMQEW